MDHNLRNGPYGGRYRKEGHDAIHFVFTDSRTRKHRLRDLELRTSDEWSTTRTRPSIREIRSGRNRYFTPNVVLKGGSRWHSKFTLLSIIHESWYGPEMIIKLFIIDSVSDNYRSVDYP